jgi:hypothetical protein
MGKSLFGACGWALNRVSILGGIQSTMRIDSVKLSEFDPKNKFK